MELNQKRAGFTLMEILIVFAIVGGIMAVLIPTILRQAGQAKNRQAKQIMQGLKADLLRYKVDMGRYPKTSEGGLQRLITPPDPKKNWSGPYIDEIPEDAWGNELEYYSPPRDKAYGAYEIVSLGDPESDDPQETIVGSK